MNTELQQEHQRAQAISKLLVVVFAHNEADALSQSLPIILKELEGLGDVHVVADNCDDRTAEIATRSGVQVFIRNELQVGKGAAIRWWAKKMGAVLLSYEAIVILDADSLVTEGFFKAVRGIASGAQNAFQVRVKPLLTADFGIAKLAALSENLEQLVGDRFRSRLNWPVRLRGTGMVLNPAILIRSAEALRTWVEDIELTILLTSQGIPIVYKHNITILDPKPGDEGGFRQQRARWLRGQGQIVRSYWKEILQICLKGPAGWSLLSSILFKPRSLIVLVMGFAGLAAILLSILLGSTFWLMISIVIAAIFVLNALYYVIGSLIIGEKNTTLLLIQSPMYLLMWLRSLILSFLPGNGWLRARPYADQELSNPTVSMVDDPEVIKKRNELNADLS